jgi:hypothetical protein
MADLLRWTLEDPAIPDDLREPAGWPTPLQEEYGRDGGTSAAGGHRAALRAGFSRVRRAIDDFKPDVVIIWGDDQYDNFREDIIPPFCILAYEDLVTRPWAQETARHPNVWGESEDTEFRIRGARNVGKYLAGQLLERGIDAAYAYRPLHHEGWAHAFMNTFLYLDYEREGLDYPALAFAVNCYGTKVISDKGGLTRFADTHTAEELDPPSPSPARCLEVGRQTARALLESPWRVALIASSSWSHAFLTDKNWRLWPDVAADQRLFNALRAGEYATWRETSLAELEESGQQELLNWFCLVGAMEELNRTPDYSEFIETYAFNSNKCFALFLPS